MVPSALALLAAGLLAGCGGYGDAAHAAYRDHHVRYGATHPSVAEQARTLTATLGYRRFLLTSSEGLAASLASVERDAAHGELAASRDAELAAQVDYDALRADIAPDSATSIQLDGEPWSLGGAPFGGLHLIERELWSSAPDLARAGRVAAALAPTAVQIAYVLSRAVMTPAQMLAEAQAQLEWAVDVPLEGREETYSHHDLADVAASVHAARTAFDLTVALGHLVDPATEAACAARFAVLASVLRSLGDPEVRPDASIRVGDWQRLAAAIDAVDAPLGSMVGDVQGFSSGRLYA